MRDARVQIFFAYCSVPNTIWAENFRMLDIGINAWSSLFDNLKINIILQDYLKCMKNDKIQINI